MTNEDMEVATVQSLRFLADRGIRIMCKQNKTELKDITGLVQTDEPTNSVQLKKEAQLNICERKLLDMEEDRDYYKTKSASLEEGYIKLQKENEQLKSICQDHRDHAIDFKADCVRLEKENEQLKMGNNSLKLLVQNWEALDEEKDEQLDKQNQALKKLKEENEQLKQQIKELQSSNNDIEWLKNNTVWEQMPTNHKSVTKTKFER